jgi:hypothetical protein
MWFEMYLDSVFVYIGNQEFGAKHTNSKPNTNQNNRKFEPLHSKDQQLRQYTPKKLFFHFL